MLFEISQSKNRKGRIKQPLWYFNFRCQFQLDHLVQESHRHPTKSRFKISTNHRGGCGRARASMTSALRTKQETILQCNENKWSHKKGRKAGRWERSSSHAPRENVLWSCLSYETLSWELYGMQIREPFFRALLCHLPSASFLESPYIYAIT